MTDASTLKAEAEQIARIIDPDGFATFGRQRAELVRLGRDLEVERGPWMYVEQALRKAEAILSSPYVVGLREEIQELRASQGRTDRGGIGVGGEVTPRESGWLIERNDLDVKPLYFFRALSRHGWTPDPNQAERFPTSTAASAECNGGDVRGALKITEHIWIALPAEGRHA